LVRGIELDALEVPKISRIRNYKKSIDAIKHYLFLIPSLLLVGTFLIYPAIRTFIISFTEWNGVTRPIWIGFQNFYKLFTYPVFRTSLINTTYWGILTLTLPVIIALLLALIINRASGGGLFKILIFLPYSLSAVAVGIVWSYMYKNVGAINEILRLIGFENFTHIWIQEVPLNTFAIINAYVWRMVGINLVLFLIGLQNLPVEPMEAAKLEGASQWRINMNIIIPMLSQTTTVVVVMAFINGLNAFDIIWVMTMGGPYRSTETLAVTMFRESFIHFNFGGGAAASVFLSIIIFAAAIFYFRVLFKDEHN